MRKMPVYHEVPHPRRREGTQAMPSQRIDSVNADSAQCNRRDDSPPLAKAMLTDERLPRASLSYQCFIEFSNFTINK